MGSLKQKKLSYGIGLIITLPILYFISLNLEFNKEDLKTISGTLTADPEFGKGRNGKRDLEIKLNEFDSRFTTDDYSYHVLNKEKLKSHVKKGDKVYLSIKKDGSRSWADRINTNFDVIAIMELWTDNDVYISIEDYNNYRKEDFKLIYALWLAGLIYYIYWFTKNRHEQFTVMDPV